MVYDPVDGLMFPDHRHPSAIRYAHLPISPVERAKIIFF